MARNDLPPPNAPNFAQRMRESMMTYLGKQGDPLDRGLTLRDLIESGIVKLKSGFGAGATTGAGALPLDPGSAIYVEDLTPPPPPTGFAVSASTVNVLFETDAPRFTVGNGHLKTVIYGKSYASGDPLPTFASAIKVTEFPGNVFAHPLDPGSTWRYWATWVSRDGVEGLPAGGTNGVAATTDLIDDAKIANLSASKIRAGAVSVGEYIESANYVPNTSGWRINGDGTAYLENAVVRGTVWANAGQIGGITIAAGAVRTQPSYDTGSGFYLGSDGWFSLGNGTQRVTWDGTTLTIRGNLDAATGTFSGALSAATGTFSGALSAATGSFSGSLSAATGTFSGALSAATGTFSGSLTASAINAVDTINLAGNSVTVPAGAQLASTHSCGTEATFLSVTLNTQGQPVWVSVDAYLRGPDATQITVKLYINGTLKRSDTLGDGSFWDSGANPNGNISYGYYEASPGSGSFDVELRSVGDAGTTIVAPSNLFALGTKR